MVRQEDDKELRKYNVFCENLSEGHILYNIDNTNQWGEYLLVVNVSSVSIHGHTSYNVLLLGLRKENNSFVPRNVRINLTPDYVGNIPFLRYIGHCNFKLVPDITDLEVNKGLVSVFSSVDLRKYTEKLSLRKPKIRKYGEDGKHIVRKAENKD